MSDYSRLDLLRLVLLIPFRCWHNGDSRYVWRWERAKYREARQLIRDLQAGFDK